MAYVISPEERASFKRCRRQWDLRSRTRQNYELAASEPRLDLDEALREALAVYYFPGMWEWNRAIVLPLVREAFERSAARQGGARSAAEAAELDDARRLLEGYCAWAPTVDGFWPIRIETDFAVQVPDARQPGQALLCEAGEVRYEGRVGLLAIDETDAYWIIEHRIARREWAAMEDLLLDERGVSFCWAWELFYQGMRIAGTMYNELRLDLVEAASAPPASGPAPDGGGPPAAAHRRMYAQAVVEPTPSVKQTGSGPFRRTRIPRSRATLDHAGQMLAGEAADMVAADLRIYPQPSPAHCHTCDYRAPCLALSAGEEPAPILADRYRQRPPLQVEEGRLGGVTWGMNRGAMPLESRARDLQRLPRRERHDDP